VEKEPPFSIFGLLRDWPNRMFGLRSRLAERDVDVIGVDGQSGRQSDRHIMAAILALSEISAAQSQS
jgi:hypothetical protein